MFNSSEIKFLKKLINSVRVPEEVEEVEEVEEELEEEELGVEELGEVDKRDTKRYKSICIPFNKHEYDLLKRLSKTEGRSLMNTIKRLIVTNSGAL